MISDSRERYLRPGNLRRSYFRVLASQTNRRFVCVQRGFSKIPQKLPSSAAVSWCVLATQHTACDDNNIISYLQRHRNHGRDGPLVPSKHSKTSPYKASRSKGQLPYEYDELRVAEGVGIH